MIENGQPDGSYVLNYGGKKIPFRIEYRQRKKLAVTVHPEPRLEILAPNGVTNEQVLSRIEKRAAWILQQWHFFERYIPRRPLPQFVSGETHLYLGRQYRLKVFSETFERVGMMGRFLQVYCADRSDTAHIRELLEEWYREHAKALFRHRMKLCIEQCPSLKSLSSTELLVRRMSRRWGSCTRAGRILLNIDLVKAPVHCVDYVIVHELCHLQIHSHSDAFYRLLSRCMPDWERRKQRLEAFGL